jgi:nitric oxide dioxygenase
VTPESVILIQSTWTRASMFADATSATFYARLFELEPALRSKFSHDLERQGRKFMAMMDTLVDSAADPQTLIAHAADLGRMHAAYDITSRHYALVCQTLLWTLERVLGSGFTPAARQAWTELYVLVASVMRRAAGRQSGAVVVIN